MRLRPDGKVHDLKRIAEKVNGKYFAGKVGSVVTYGRDTSGRAVRSRRLGSFRRDNNLIVIHPMLDDPHVPEMVVEFTIYHEMLHAIQPIGTRRPHGGDFHRAERAHPDYEEVRRWKKENSDLLLRAGKR